MSPTPETVARLWPYSGRVRVAASVAVGLVAFLVDFAVGPKGTAPLVGWDAGAALSVLWIMLVVFRLDSGNTDGLASSRGPDRTTLDLFSLLASLASLGGVALVLLDAAKAHDGQKDLLAAIGALSVVCSWFLVHVLYALRYARLYYDECEGGGIDFNEEEKPAYLDFAYLAFTVGMTFQVSDTDIKDKRIRRTILHHALLSYLFGTVIVATTINLVAGLGGK